MNQFKRLETNLKDFFNKNPPIRRVFYDIYVI